MSWVPRLPAPKTITSKHVKGLGCLTLLADWEPCSLFTNFFNRDCTDPRLAKALSVFASSPLSVVVVWYTLAVVFCSSSSNYAFHSSPSPSGPQNVHYHMTSRILHITRPQPGKNFVRTMVFEPQSSRCILSAAISGSRCLAQ